MKQCKTCGHWKRALIEFCESDKPDIYGSCSCNRFVFAACGEGYFNRMKLGRSVGPDHGPSVVVTDDQFIHWDASGYLVEFKTGQHFGCVHHKDRI